MKLLYLSSAQFFHVVHLTLGDTGSGYIKKESTRRSSNKWKKTLNRVYLRCVTNFCATVSNKSSKEITFLSTPNVKKKI